ncbi:MerC domain-containing protein [Teredinibacter purpureus]|uniref:MerC domain-containing protein n=1 Tax=Teredinibacter purpureus TaxID=2731756 RepID=UPI000697219A|nr:MerC domain-containing protein [Teredinibacter purpureus]
MKDVLGAACSGLCLVHCLALPVLATTGTTFVGLAALSGEATHLWLSAAMIIIALWAFPKGWRVHKHLLPGLLALAGFGLMTAALMVAESMEVYWAVAAGITFIAGHLINRHLLITRNLQ